MPGGLQNIITCMQEFMDDIPVYLKLCEGQRISLKLVVEPVGY